MKKSHFLVQNPNFDLIFFKAPLRKSTLLFSCLDFKYMCDLTEWKLVLIQSHRYLTTNQIRPIFAAATPCTPCTPAEPAWRPTAPGRRRVSPLEWNRSPRLGNSSHESRKLTKPNKSPKFTLFEWEKSMICSSIASGREASSTLVTTTMTTTTRILRKRISPTSPGPSGNQVVDRSEIFIKQFFVLLWFFLPKALFVTGRNSDQFDYNTTEDKHVAYLWPYCQENCETESRYFFNF